MRYLFIVFSVIVFSCSNNKSSTTKTEEDVLPSWNQTDIKTNIKAFVEKVTDSSSNNFIPVNKRIAVFDNDGTLWAEQPLYFQLYFAMDRLKAMAEKDSSLKTVQPYKAILENDMKTFMSFGEKGLLELVLKSHGNISSEEFSGEVKSWIATAKHPKYNKSFTQLVYKPMLELLEYLRENNFKTFIVSGGGIDFMRPWTEEVYGIPPYQVIGSSLDLSYTDKNEIYREPHINHINDKAGKPVGIQKHIGIKPVLAVGNSDGDLQMLKWTASNPVNFTMIIHHTDEKREWAYDSLSHIGKLNKAFDMNKTDGTHFVDMKKDWNKVFNF